jgi:phage gp16-like protein
MSRPAFNPFRKVGVPSRPASFAPDPAKRSMIAKIKVAQKQLGMQEDDYRALLLRVTGEGSSTRCSLNQLEAMINALKTKGFTPLPKAGSTRTAKAASHPSARKARALWISLHQLGVVENPSEAALEGFVKRQMKVEAFAWANQQQCYKVIEALKSWANREGWDQDVSGIPDPSHALKVLKLRLCRAILGRMKDDGLVPANWTLSVAAHRLLGIEDSGAPEMWPIGRIDLVAQGLSAKRAAPVKPLSHEDYL